MLTALFCAFADLVSRPLADVPFNASYGYIRVKAHLNGRPISAMLDTGSERCCADVGLARAVGARLKAETSRIASFSAWSKAWRPTNLRLSLDGLKATHEVVLATPLSEFAGESGSRPGVLVGSDFLKRFVVEIDYPKSRLRFYDPKAYVPSPDADALPIRLVKGIPVAALSLKLPKSKPQSVQAAVDTGSSGIVAFTGALARRERLVRRLPEVKRYGIEGSSRAKVWILEGSTESLGNLDFEGQVFVDDSKRGATGPRSPFDALLGGQLFAKCTLTFDYRQSKMYLGYPQ